MRRLFKQIFNKPQQQNIVEVGKPEPISMLERVSANVKVMWKPSTTKDLISQHIKIIGKVTGKVFIEKDLDPYDYAFSFSASKGAALVITITAYNGRYSDPVTIELTV